MYWFLQAIKKYADFTGRARRKEYWMFGLVNFLVNMVIALLLIIKGLKPDYMFYSDEMLLGILLKSIGLLIFSIIFNFAMVIPGLSVSVRRLHDTNRSGWWLLINLVPIIGSIFFFLFTIEDSTPGENIYGPNPKEGELEAPRVTPSEIKKCPQCGELVSRELRVCPHCNYEFYQIPKTIEEEIEEFEKQQKQKSTNYSDSDNEII
jgi:uncharacterized membrane protein YhaH (DUF805 family)/ribosomal protein L32